MALELDKKRTAVLIADFQNENVSTLSDDAQMVLQRAAAVLAWARRVGIPIIHVVMGFRDGHPEVMPHLRRRYEGRFLQGSEGAKIHVAVAPQPGEVVVKKRRTGPFSTTDLNAVLHAYGVDTLMVLGMVTSGCILSTIRWAADIDYRLVVIADACVDRDPEVHRMLVEKVFPFQATVLTSMDLASIVV